MSKWEPRTFKLLYRLSGALIVLFSVGTGFARALSAEPRVVVTLIVLSLVSWAGVVTVSVAEYRVEGPETARAPRRTPFKTAVLALAAVVVACLVGMLAGAAVSSLTGSDHAGSRSYAAKLSRAFREFEQERSRAYGQLRETEQPAKQAGIVADLAKACRRAAATLNGSHLDGWDRRLNGLIVERLKTLGNSYGRLRRAIRDPGGGQGAVDAARDAVARATQRLHAAEEMLRRHGYRLVAANSP